MKTTLEKIPGGFTGTAKTIKKMVELSLNGRSNPYVLGVVAEALRGVPARDDYGATKAIFNWVKENVRYTPDPISTEKKDTVELVRHPEVIVKHRIGDCDDMAILLSSMLLSAGIPSKFRTVKTTSDNFTHVYVMAKIRGNWYALDPTISYSYIGWEHPMITEKKDWDIEKSSTLRENISSLLKDVGDDNKEVNMDELLESIKTDIGKIEQEMYDYGEKNNQEGMHYGGSDYQEPKILLPEDDIMPLENDTGAVFMGEDYTLISGLEQIGIPTMRIETSKLFGGSQVNLPENQGVVVDIPIEYLYNDRLRLKLKSAMAPVGIYGLGDLDFNWNPLHYVNVAAKSVSRGVSKATRSVYNTAKSAWQKAAKAGAGAVSYLRRNGMTILKWTPLGIVVRVTVWSGKKLANLLAKGFKWIVRKVKSNLNFINSAVQRHPSIKRIIGSQLDWLTRHYNSIAKKVGVNGLGVVVTAATITSLFSVSEALVQFIKTFQKKSPKKTNKKTTQQPTQQMTAQQSTQQYQPTQQTTEQYQPTQQSTQTYTPKQSYTSNKSTGMSKGAMIGVGIGALALIMIIKKAL